MGKRRKKVGKKGYGGGGGGSANTMNALMVQVIGGVILLVSLILFGIAVGQLDTAYTSANTYDQVGLTSIMGIFGMIIFLVFVGTGLAIEIGAAVMLFKKAGSGGWMDALMVFAYAAVGLVIAFILNTIVQGELNTQQVAINALTNISNFSGLYNISRIFGMLIFLGLSAPAIGGIAGIVKSAVGAVKRGM